MEEGVGRPKEKGSNTRGCDGARPPMPVQGLLLEEPPSEGSAAAASSPGLRWRSHWGGRLRTRQSPLASWHASIPCRSTSACTWRTSSEG